MTDLEKKRIDPHHRERRERIATAVFSQLVGAEGQLRPDHPGIAVKAADALMEALDAETT